MEIGHSRLLKFLLDNAPPIMSGKQELRVEYISQPTVVVSEVPAHQNMREPPAEEESKQSDKANDGTFVPVYNTKKEEAVLTKGDMKLQKISVTEDISNKNNNQIHNPMYSEVHSEVLHDDQPIRIAPKKTAAAETGEKPESDTPRSKIPQLRHKVDMIKQNRDERNARKMVSKHPRRSSIPKLKRVETPSLENIPKTENKFEQRNNLQPGTNDTKNGNVPPEEDFDKIFDQIIHNDDETTDELINNYEGAEKLEHSFDEIVHDYEENKIRPIDVKQIRNKNPFIKQKSLPEEKFAKKFERRSSLKDIQTDNNDNDEYKVNLTGSKLDEMEIKNRIKNVKEKDSNVESKQISDNNITKINKNPTAQKEAIPVVPKNESKDDREIEYLKPIITIDKENDDKTTGDHVKINDGKNDMEENTKMDVESNKLPENVVKPSEQEVKDEITSDRKNKTTYIPKLRGAISKLTNKSSNIPTGPPKRDPVNEIPKKTSIISKIAVFDKKSESNKVKSNSFLTPDTYNIVSEPIEKEKQTTTATENLDKPTNKLVYNTDHVTSAVSQETELNDNPVSADDFIKVTEKDTNEPTKLVQKIRRDSVEGIKLLKDEIVPTKMPATLNTKLKLKLDSIAPPNSPLALENDPYRDSAHLAGEPKILNIDIHDDSNFNKSLEPNINIDTSNRNDNDNIYQKAPNTHNGKQQFATESKQSARDIYNQMESDRNPDIDFHSPNPDEFDRAPLFDAVNKKLNTESNQNKYEENSLPIKGKVNKIINRIDSIDEKSIDITIKNKAAVEIPIKKSVSSKIAMFESQTPLETKPKPKVLHDSKPKIIEEVLKAQPPRKTGLQNESGTENTLPPKNKDKERNIYDNTVNIETIEHVAKVLDVNVSTESIQENMTVDKTDNIVKLVDFPVKNNTTADGQCNNQQNRKEIKRDEHRVKLENTELFNIAYLPKREKEAYSVKEKINSIKTVSEEGNLKKSKSVAELDLGDAVKGKVNQLIMRMNSIENIVLEKKHDNINIRERPRKKSVSEKIAMFENKLVVFEKVDKPTFIKKAPVTARMPAPSPDYSQVIKELNNAKTKYGRMEDIMYLKLQNGQNMPVLSLGTALMDPTLLPHIIGAAIDLGYRAIDTAYIYGNERQVGEAIKAKIDDGTVERKDLFIIGKLWSTFHRQDLVEKACSESLANLGMEYFDLYLIHNPMSFKEESGALPTIANVLQYSEVADYIQAWYGMETLVKKGLAKGIGVSNFNSVQIEKLLEKGKLKPVVNQVECHPYLAQRRLDEFCGARNVWLMCYGTLGSKGTPAEFKDNKESVIDDPMVKVMAAGLDITPAQLLIGYQIECGHAVVTKGSSAEHLWENLQAQSTKLDGAQIDALHALNNNKRTYSMLNMGDTHPNYPFKIPF